MTAGTMGRLGGPSLRALEIASLLVAAACLLAWAGGRTAGWVGHELALRSFERQLAAGPAPWLVAGPPGVATTPGGPAGRGHAAGLVETTPDRSEWSPKRRTEYDAARAVQPGEPLGRLDIPSLGLSVVVLEGIDDWALNRGVGRIPGTGQPGDPGNVGIAGHRDGFFRGLRKIAPGAEILLTREGGVDRYRVRDVVITDPKDVSVLEQDGRATLTLVTCHPFFHVGNAPRRWIVRADAVALAGVDLTGDVTGGQ